MEPFEVLKQLEELYDLLIPATENSHEAFAWFSGVPHPLFNAVMHLSCKGALEAKIEALLKQAPKNKPISFWSHPYNNADGLDESLIQRGFAEVITCGLMAWEVKPRKEPDLTIERADKKTFNDILAEVNHFDGIVKKAFCDLLEHPQLENYLVRHEEKAAGVGSLFYHGQAGGIFNLSTLEAHQRKGCARAMMQFLMNRANELDLKQVVLLSAPISADLFRSLGFVKVCDIKIFALTA
jgi:N-acetylglutamate synthase-like GNAT family acetyltransferase